MIWLAVMLGVALTTFGAIAGAALITVSRAELTLAVGRRLRGTSSSLAESRLPVGSSSSSTLGFMTSARATATRCCWPPESCVGR